MRTLYIIFFNGALVHKLLTIVTRYFVSFIKIKKQPFADVLQISLLNNLAILSKKHLCWSLFQYTYSPVKIVKFLRTDFL